MTSDLFVESVKQQDNWAFTLIRKIIEVIESLNILIESNRICPERNCTSEWGLVGQWSVLARSFLACIKPWCVFTAALVWKTRSDFAEAGKEQGGMWSCVPQELWTSYLHSLSSPWTTDQRQGGIWWLPPHSLPPPFLFVSPLSVSLTPLLPFSLLLSLSSPPLISGILSISSPFHPFNWFTRGVLLVTDVNRWTSLRFCHYRDQICFVYMSLKMNPYTFKLFIHVEFVELLLYFSRFIWMLPFKTYTITEWG